jgi:hypothetical protein
MVAKKVSKSRELALKSILSKITEFSSAGIKQNSHQNPDKGYDLLSWLQEDVTLRAALEIKYTTLVKIGYHFAGGLTPEEEEKLKKIRFDKWLRQNYWQVMLYRNSFTELGLTSTGEVESLNLIKTDEVEIVNDPHGEVISYLQIPSNVTDFTGGDKFIVTLPKDRVFHISTNQISTSLWGSSEVSTVLPVLRKKKLIEDFIGWLFETNQFRSVIKIPEGVQDEDMEKYMDMLIQSMLNPSNFLILQGNDAEVSMLRKIEGFGDLLNILDYYRSQILALLQLPPLQVGILESSNRSSSEYQVRYAFYTHIIGQLTEIQDEINNELMPRLGIKKKFMFNLVDDIAAQNLLKEAQMLSQLGANPKKLNAWLVKQGYDIPLNLLEEPEKLEVEGQDTNSNNKNSNVKLDKNSDLHPSRQKTEMDFAGGSRKK